MRRTLLATAAVVLFATGARTETPPENPQVTQVLAAIKGKENRPAGEVFRNVKLLKDAPAARLLRIMDLGYSRALGVSCDHCHVEERWEADEKRAKEAAREMIVLTQRINQQLGEMQHIDNSEPSVNCTTCHRGYVKPALQMR